MIRYRFSDFTLSPRRRLLLREGREVPLIPRYFDLLVMLVERRHEAVHRRDIFDRVWSDVVVSDSALSQAIRTIRRTLGDDSRLIVRIAWLSALSETITSLQIRSKISRRWTASLRRSTRKTSRSK